MLISLKWHVTLYETKTKRKIKIEKLTIYSLRLENYIANNSENNL